ncbi:MAG: response regulator [Leptospiraceae bacterium]|nr:response regulator [Leptospiraceae bacterium]
MEIPEVAGRTGQVRTGVVENDEQYRTYLISELSRIPFIASGIRSWSSAEQFLHEENRKDLDLLLLDIDLSGISGVQLAGILALQQPELPIVILSNLTSDEAIFEAIKNGVKGYLLKSELSSLEDAIHVVMGGGAMITPTIALRVMSSFQKVPASGPDLTDRERQILELMVRGKTIKSVADFLMLSPHTVHDHVKRIYKKLEVHNRAELVRKVQELQLI